MIPGNSIRPVIIFFLLSLTFSSAISQAPLEEVMKSELDREYAILSKQKIPAYYLAYRVTELESLSLRASFGALVDTLTDNERVLYVSLRVGDHTFDQTHQVDEFQEWMGFGGGYGMNFPLENHDKVLTRKLWEVTQERYRTAVSSYENLLDKRKEVEKNGDFTHEDPWTYHDDEPGSLEDYLNRSEWEQRLRELSGVFVQGKEFVEGTAGLRFEIQRRYFVSSEGSMIIENAMMAQLVISGKIACKDGDVLPMVKVFYARTPADLPSPDSIEHTARQVVAMLRQLKEAPKATPYSGPAILSPGAAGVFFHEIFGHRIEGHRLTKKTDGQTFRKKIGQEVINSMISIYSDPTQNEYKGSYLAGSYAYDDEGIPGQRVTVIEDGVLRNFLMSRKPVDEIKKSNGHGRSSPYMAPVARQSNLFVQASKTSGDEQLRRKLIRMCRKRGLEYGYYFKEVSGGYTSTDRYRPNAFNITPLVVYRVYVDNRPDELVRGVSLIGTPLVMFSEIEAAGDTPEVFNGICGAESGGVPTSTICPALLVGNVETQKVPEQEIKVPELKMPGTAGATK